MVLFLLLYTGLNFLYFLLLSGTVCRSFSEVGTLPLGTSTIEKLDSGQRKLEKSKTEAQRHQNILAEEAAQIFDNKICAQQKVLSFLDESPVPIPFVSVYI